MRSIKLCGWTRGTTADKRFTIWRKHIRETAIAKMRRLIITELWTAIVILIMPRTLRAPLMQSDKNYERKECTNVYSFLFLFWRRSKYEISSAGELSYHLPAP